MEKEMRLNEIKRFDNIEISNFKEFFNDPENYKRFLTPSYRTGWLTPENNLIIVRGYGHLDYIGEFSVRGDMKFNISLNSELKNKIEELWSDASEEFGEFEYNYSSGLDPDEHPAWHNVDMAGSEIDREYESKTLDLLYDYGWSRIGMVTGRKGPMMGQGNLKMSENNKFIIELETKNKSHIHPAKKLAKVLDAELIVTER